jgi:hypothetical protein
MCQKLIPNVDHPTVSEVQFLIGEIGISRILTPYRADSTIFSEGPPIRDDHCKEEMLCGWRPGERHEMAKGIESDGHVIAGAYQTEKPLGGGERIHLFAAND